MTCTCIRMSASTSRSSGPPASTLSPRVPTLPGHQTFPMGRGNTSSMPSNAQRVQKAVIPAAGLGTRFLPATKAQPKEMLPVVDKPAIQYVVEEAVQAGLRDILIITGRGKRSLEDHFDRSFELEHYLEAGGKFDLLKEMQEIADMAEIH